MTKSVNNLSEIPRDQFERVWGFVKELNDQEKHFNQLQSGYRTLASTWLLAAFAGVGFVLTSNNWQVGIDRDLVAILISIAGAIGIYLVWFLDVPVCHELLVSSNIEGKQLEKDFSWIPQTRLNYSKLSGKFHVRDYIAIFYCAGIFVLCFLAILIYFQSELHTSWFWLPLVLGMLLIGNIVYFTIISSIRKDKLVNDKEAGKDT